MTIKSMGQNLAMDGRNFNSGISGPTPQQVAQSVDRAPMEGASAAAQSIAQNIAQTQEDVRQIQKLSDVVMGRKVQFNVNQELNQVVVRIVDPQTDAVIKEIPSADIQKLKVRIRHAIGVLFDEMI